MTQRAFEELIEFASKRLEIIPSARGMNQEKMDQTFYELTKDRGFDLVIDGVLGMQGRAGARRDAPGGSAPLGDETLEELDEKIEQDFLKLCGINPDTGGGIGQLAMSWRLWPTSVRGTVIIAAKASSQRWRRHQRRKLPCQRR